MVVVVHPQITRCVDALVLQVSVTSPEAKLFKDVGTSVIFGFAGLKSETEIGQVRREERPLE